MTNLRRIAFLVFVLAAGCGTNSGFVTDSGTDATMSGDGRTCASNTECDDQTPCTQDLCLVGGVCSNTPMAGACDAGMCVSGRGCVSSTMTCTSAAQCNDSVDCTADACLVNGTCQHTVNNNLCAPGQMCTLRGCVAGGCMTPADCDDHFDCTLDSCQSNGTCAHTAQNNRCTAPQVCNPMMGCVVPSSCGNDSECDDNSFCNGRERCSPELACIAGTPVNCDDMNACTVDACSNTTMACTHTMNPSCSMMVRSGIYTISPAITYRCAFGMYTFMVSTVQFALSGGRLTVMGTPVPLSSTAPTGASFDVTGQNPGSCTENYRMTGMFTDSTHFSATISVDFVDDGSGFSCAECTMRSYMVTGTAMM